MPNNKPENFDVIIIGAGAAGLMCAVESGKRGRKTIVLEHNDAVGKKIRISGGGRCNFTNIHALPKNYLSDNPHFVKSPLSRYTPQDFCHLVNTYNIAYHEKKLGQLFCDKSSQEIISMLKKECERNKVEISLNTQVKCIECSDVIARRTKSNEAISLADKIASLPSAAPLPVPWRSRDRRNDAAKKTNLKAEFIVTTERCSFKTQSLVIATGGLSIANLGATDFGYKIAKQFGLKVNPCRPGLVPLTLKPEDLKQFQQLSGISVDAAVSFGPITFRENILFTHRGLSGPAILQISSYWQRGKPIAINLLPDLSMSEVLKKHQTDKTTLKNFLKDYLPSRLSDILCEHQFNNKPLNQYAVKELDAIARFLNHWELTPQGTEGYAKAEVTVGGVDCDELSSKTLESIKVPGLYFVGEVVDVTGHLGGFNFQWAWASGHAAGQFV